MTTLIEKLKAHTSRALIGLSTPQQENVVWIADATQKTVRCPNHFIEFRGVRKENKVLLTFGGMDEVTCVCGTTYRKDVK